ncbi:MAG TPA: pantoate--beta-alanine ligase [Solirubrobacterales bacterium]|jgi:pantoate--beta-alanine ligase|nr:pantoate--beta-alanine ligase [Solirubrobacterales bacterium]
MRDRFGPVVKTITTVDALRAELDAARAEGLTVGLVPTMGALHEGHLSLIDRSVADCGVTVVSIFVNPTQFRPGEDLDRYPRQLERDSEHCAGHGTDILFAPPLEEIYPDGFSSNVSIRGITETLCGDRTRRGPEHFDGVATVVAKLFNIAQPNFAYFGQKDAQQVAVIRRLVSDLDFRVQVVSCPTVREQDGLAMSSRNAYLSPEDRGRALGLFAALCAAREAVSKGERDAERVTAAALEQLDAVDRVEYFELVDPDTLEPVESIERPVLAAVAAQVGATRLIDNTILQPAPVADTAISYDFPPLTRANNSQKPITQGAAV